MKKVKELAGKYIIYLVLLLVIVIFAVISPQFATVSNGFTVLRQVSMQGIAAVGMTFIMITGGIDLSQGSMVTLTNILCAFLMMKSGLPIPAACLLTVLVLTVAGLLEGILISKLKIPPFIITLAFMNILKGIAYIMCNGLPIYGFEDSFATLGQGYIAGIIPIPVILAIIALAIGSFILNETTFGRHIYAIGGNEEASLLSGIDVDMVKLKVYALNGLFAGIAGVVMLSRLNTGQPSTGDGFEFEVITGVVLGGVSVSGGAGKLSGVIAGLLIMGVLNNGLVIIGVTEYVQWVVKGVILVLALAFDRIQVMRANSVASERKTAA